MLARLIVIQTKRLIKIIYSKTVDHIIATTPRPMYSHQRWFVPISGCLGPPSYLAPGSRALRIVAVPLSSYEPRVFSLVLMQKSTIALMLESIGRQFFHLR